jgi:integrase
MALSARTIETNKEPGMHLDGRGLYLCVQNNGSSKSWVFRFQLNGKRREMGIGSATTVSGPEARLAAEEIRKLVSQGIDPIEQRKAEQAAKIADQEVAQRKVVTFADAAKDFIDAKAPGWTNPKHVDQWRNTVATYCNKFAAKPVNDVTIEDVEAALRQIWLEKTETATRLLQRIVQIVAHASDKGWREQHDAEGWPTRLRRRLPMLPKKKQRVEHHPALPYEQASAFMEVLRQSVATGSRALEFAVLCASRSGEVRLARWGEIDLKTAIWTIPGNRMKAKKIHRVPLSQQAVFLLGAVRPKEPQANDLIFPSMKGTALSDATMNAFIKRQNKKELKWKDDEGRAIVQHGFRSSFSDWVSECTKFDRDTREMALAHTVEDEVEAAYRRGDLFTKRRELMQAWADYLDNKEAKVIPLRGSAA